MANKIAGSHVEMVLSLVLFVSFLFFVFIIINPLSKTKQNIIFGSEQLLIDSLSSEIGKLSIILNSINDCYDLSNVNQIYGDNFVEISDPINPGKLTIYYGDIFDPSIMGQSCSYNLSHKFSFGGYQKENFIVYGKILALKNDYESNYELTRESLGIRDFAFSFKKLDGTKIDELSIDSSYEKIPGNVDVYSNEILVRVVDNQANIQELVLNIKFW